MNLKRLDLKSDIIIILGTIYILTVNYLAYNQFLNPEKWRNLQVAIAPLPMAIIIDGGIILSLIITGIWKWAA